jgi:hypothetical protein
MRRRWPGLAALVAATLLWCAAPAARADEGAAESRSEAFRTVEGALQEDVPGGPLLVGAYALILAAVLGYVIHLVRLQSRMSGDIERLTRAIEKRGEGSES